MEQPTEKQMMFAETLGIENPSQYDKKTLSGMINAKVGKEENPKPSQNKFFAKAPASVPVQDKNSTMYVSYAKDIFLELMKIDDALTFEGKMSQAVALVKQAKQAFN